MATPLNNQEIRKLKALAQHLEPIVHLGREGVTDSLIEALKTALAEHELVKLRFVGCKEQKKELAPLIAEKSDSTFVTRVGNVAVYFRASDDPSRPRILG